MGDPALPSIGRTNDRGKAGPHRDIGGSPYAEPASACHARAPRPSTATCGLASLFLARAQPLLPLPPASQSRQPSRCRARVDATDANSAAHSPEATEGEGQQYTTTTSHNPRWPALASAISPSRPGPTSLRLASSASNQVAPLFFSECSGSTTSEAGPTGGPACPAMPPTPHPLGSMHQLTAPPAPPPRVVSWSMR